MNRTFKLSCLAAAMGALMTPLAYADSDIVGRVSDNNQQLFFEGALVEIKELKLKRTTQQDGSFRFNNVADGNYTLRITYLGADPIEYPVTIKNGKTVNKVFALTTSDEIEEVIAYGQAASQASALNRQKNASNLKTIVSSDSIGQLPDQNAAEALQRLPGISIQRDQGEGRFVSIRGIDPNLNNVSINGMNIPSPEVGVRSVAMDVIPSELIEGLEVSKTVTPDMDADAIGGSINVKSLSAFDRADGSMSATLQASYNKQIEEVSPKASVSYSKIFALENGHQLGLATAVSWFKRDFSSHNIETDGGWGEVEFEDNQTGDDVEGFGAEEMEQRYYQVTRERTGTALNLDLHTKAGDKYYLRTLYSNFSDDEFRLRNEYKFEDGSVNASSWTSNTGDFFGGEMDRDTKDRYEEQKILSIVAGGENQLDNWLVEYSMGYTKSSEKEPNRIDADFKGEDIDFGYTSSGPAPVLYQSANTHDLSNFELDEIATDNNNTEDEEVSFKLDLSKDFVWNNNNGLFKFGGKYRAREKFVDIDHVVYDGGFGDVTAANFAGNYADWSLGNFGPTISRAAIHQYVNSNIGQLEVNQLDTQAESIGLSYSSEEDIFAAYAMVELDINKWHIVTGLRYETTDFATAGNSTEVKTVETEAEEYELVTATPVNISKDYDYLLPSLNVRYDFSEKLVARFAYTQTIARPTFGDASAYQVITIETEEDDGEIETKREAEVGNPHLKPYESQNLDFSIEYYPGGIGVLSAGLFHKEIDNFIVITEVQDNGQWNGFDEVIQAVNGTSATISGAELSWSKTYDSGLILAANGTFTDADYQLPNQSDTVGNLTIGYETNQLSARLTMNHKSESFLQDDGDFRVYQDSHSQWDLNVKYYLSDNVNLYFNGVNLNDEPYYIYHGESQYNYQYETYGRTFEFGINWLSF